MRSAALKLGEIVDCRQIKLSGTFYSLTSKMADKLVQDYDSFIRDNFSENCILNWSTSPRKTALSSHAVLCNFQKQYEVYSLYLYAYVKSNIVYNKTSLKEFERFKSRSGVFGPIPGGDMSIDYSNYYYRRIKPHTQDPVSYKKALLELFDLEGKIPTGEYFASDIQGSCWKWKNKGSCNLFWGEFTLSAGLFCLDGEVDTWAEKFLQFGKALSEKYKNVNIQIELNSISETYVRYYGEYLKQGLQDQNDSLLRNCANHLYFMGVGWANIASPATLELETLRLVDPSSKMVKEEILPGGAKLIRLNNSISQTRINDLKEIKRHIYSLIMPRKNKPDLQNRPRCYWEMIPVFENEMTIIGGEFYLEHKGYVDQQKIYHLMNVIKVP